jgi:hypothetical protein
LEELAEWLGYSHPHEIREVAHKEGFYTFDENVMDYALNPERISDYITRYTCSQCENVSIIGGLLIIDISMDSTTEAETTKTEKTVRRSYYVHHTSDFTNAYHLYYADTAADLAALPEGAKRITRKKALLLAREESDRRKYNSAFSSFADIAIYPAADCVDGTGGYIYVDWYNDRRYSLSGRIWERVKK